MSKRDSWGRYTAFDCNRCEDTGKIDTVDQREVLRTERCGCRGVDDGWRDLKVMRALGK